MTTDNRNPTLLLFLQEAHEGFLFFCDTININIRIFMEDYKRNTVESSLKRLDESAHEAEHHEVCEEAVNTADRLSGLLTHNDAIELHGILNRQIAVRKRMAEVVLHRIRDFEGEAE